MSATNILFLNCTLKTAPEVSNTEALWNMVAQRYQQQGHHAQTMRTIDSNFVAVLEKIRAADILILGVPVQRGVRSSECQRLVEKLQQVSALANRQLAAYNKVFGLVTNGDTSCAAQTCYDFSQLGYTLAPHSTIAWIQPIDTGVGFIESGGKDSVEVNKSARLLVENTVAIARALRQHPLTADPHQATHEARAIAKAAAVDTAGQIAPKPICTDASKSKSYDTGSPHGNIYYKDLTKRIWTVMQAGMERGFEFKVLGLQDRTFRAERDGKGFIYKIYPGHFSFRRQYLEYGKEQTKSHKIVQMQAGKLPVPRSYGLFKTFSDIPVETLSFPVVAKPDSGSLSENVFTNITNINSLEQAVATIAATGNRTQVEAHVMGCDYRVLVINHQYAGCVERRPANVTGDGDRTILELFHARNQEAGRGDRYEAHTTIHKLVFDDTSRRLLQAAGYTLETILPAKKRFYLQEKITASTGSDYVDCTSELHAQTAQMCIDFSRRFSTLTVGFDLLTSDITRPLSEAGGAFNEYNFLPYVDLHENCNIGQKRPVCRLIWDYIEANESRIVTPEFDVF